MISKDLICFLNKYMAIPSPEGYIHTVLEICKKDLEAMGLSTYHTKKGAIIAVFL